MNFATPFPDKFCAAVVLALSLVVVPVSAAETAPVHAPIPVVAQAAQDAPVGDARPATLGDIKHTNARIDAQGRELRELIVQQGNKHSEALNAMWTAIVLGLAAVFAAIIALAAAIIQSGRQARAQSSPQTPSRAGGKLQIAAAVVLIAIVVAAAVPAVLVVSGKQTTAVAAVEKTQSPENPDSNQESELQ